VLEFLSNTIAKVNKSYRLKSDKICLWTYTNYTLRNPSEMLNVAKPELVKRLSFQSLMWEVRWKFFFSHQDICCE